ncbi:MAG: hypothetical protein H6925_02450 [Holosporaceae bacterium]|nr:MAG: hypothetical protein H6925_02450 [Holosporaceae bacterium]
MAKEADESKGFLDDLSYVINTVINWSWNRILDKTVLGDSGWDLVNKSPSVWPLLEGADHIETIGIDHGTPYNLINAIATKLFGDRKETLDVYCDVPELNQVQREKLRSGTPDKHIYMIAEAAVREFFSKSNKVEE